MYNIFKYKEYKKLLSKLLKKVNVNIMTLSLNRHQTTLGVYVNIFETTSVVWRYTLQSIGPSGVALYYQ